MKKRVTIYLTDEMKKELKKQAKKTGSSMSSYIAYLLWVVKLQKLRSLIQNEGDEED